MRLPALAVLMLLAGCATPSQIATTVDARFTTAWTLDAAGFVLEATAELPPLAMIIVEDVTTGASERFEPSRLARSDAGSFSVPSTLPLVAGHEYRVLLRVGDATLAERTVRAMTREIFDAEDAAAHAVYDFVGGTRNVSGAEVQDVVFHLAMDFHVSPDRMEFEASGRGWSNATNDTSAFHFALDRVEMAQADGLWTRQLMEGAGTWHMEDAQMRGSGTSSILMSWAGREVPPDASGAAEPADRVSSIMSLTGSFVSDGLTMPFEMTGTSDEWSDTGTGRTVWKAESQTMTFTVLGQPDTRTTQQEGPGEGKGRGEGAFSFLRAKTVAGAAPWPMAVGDGFETKDEEGSTKRWTASDSPPFSLSGATLPAIRVTGSSDEGEYEQTLVGSGPFAGVMLLGAAVERSGTETSTMRLIARELTAL